MKKLLPLFILLIAFQVADAQYNWEFGAKVGVSGFLGDIGGGGENSNGYVTTDLQIQETKWTGGFFSRYRFTSRWSAGLFLTHARIGGNDNRSSDPARRGRNLSFYNDIWEFVGRADFAIYNNYDVGNRGYYNPDFKLYLFAGFGGVVSNPKTKYEGEVHNLRLLTTENVEYGAIQAVVPVGLGMFFTWDRTHRVGMELQHTFAFTDYLDDISTVYADPEALPSDISRKLANRRDEFVPANENDVVPHPNNYTAGNKRGNPNNNDAYVYINFYYSYVLRGKSTFYKRGQYNFLHRKNKKRRKSRAKF